MGNSSKAPGYRDAFRSALLLFLMPILAGCATSKSRFASAPKADPPLPAAVQATQNSGADSPSPPILAQPASFADVVPVAYQQSAEEIPSLTAPESVYPLDMSTALALVAGKNPQVA